MIIQVRLSVVPVRAQVRKGINRLRNAYIPDYTLLFLNGDFRLYLRSKH